MKMEKKLIFSEFNFNLDQNFFDNSKINLKLEKVSNDDYTKYIFNISTSKVKPSNMF